MASEDNMGTDTRTHELADALERAVGSSDSAKEMRKLLSDLRERGVERPGYNLAPAYGNALEHLRQPEAENA